MLIFVSVQLAIWFARDFIGNSVTVALVGVLIGPTYPICMSLCTKVLPRSLHASGIGFIASLGQTGSALFPFITGALAQRFNPGVLQPVMIVLFGVQMAIWVFGPSVGKKKE
jgi:fucose permease